MIIPKEHYRLPIDKLLKITLQKDSKIIFGRFVAWDYIIRNEEAFLPSLGGLYFRYSSEKDSYYKNIWECQYRTLSDSEIAAIEIIAVTSPHHATAVDYMHSGCSAYKCKFYFFDFEVIGVISEFFPVTEPGVFYLVRNRDLEIFKSYSEGDYRNEDKMRFVCVKIDFEELIAWVKHQDKPSLS